MANQRPIYVATDGSKKQVTAENPIDPAVLPPGFNGEAVAVKLDTSADLPDPLDPELVYFVGDPKSLVQLINGVPCYTPLAVASALGIDTGGNTVLADENGAVLWRL